MKLIPFLGGIGFSLFSVLASASPLTVSSNQFLEITFTLPPINNLNAAAKDTAYLAIGSTATGSALHATASLFDGTSFLGNNNSSFGETAGFPFYFYWTNSGSSFNLPQATPIDGNSLIDRSIAGRFVVSFDGDFTFDTDNIYLGVGNGFNGSIVITDGNAALTGLSVVAIPEPEINALMLVGLALIGAAIRRKQRAE